MLGKPYPNPLHRVEIEPEELVSGALHLHTIGLIRARMMLGY